MFASQRKPRKMNILLYYSIWCCIIVVVQMVYTNAQKTQDNGTCSTIPSDIRCRFINKEEEICYSILGQDLQFSCWGSPCSTHNEGYWFGTQAFYKGSHFIGTRSSGPESILAMNNFWATFINMSTFLGSPIINEHMEKLEIPIYATKLRDKNQDQLIVPLICHPKAFLYCENSLNSGHQVTGTCSCNLLYSLHIEKNDDDICLGRPSTPCGFELVDSFPDEDALRRTPALKPIGLRDGVDALCIPNARCLPFRDKKERNLFREGKIWHGFGYSPIVVEMILRSATRICKCNNGFVENKMHDCVIASTTQ